MYKVALVLALFIVWAVGCLLVGAGLAAISFAGFIPERLGSALSGPLAVSWWLIFYFGVASPIWQKFAKHRLQALGEVK